MEKIETIIANIATGIEQQRSISIPLRVKSRKPVLQQILDGDPSQNYKVVHTSWPGKSTEEAKRFTILLRILELIHEALSEEKIVSKRNIYYQDPMLFGTQAVVDRYVDAFAYTFDLRRADLNVTAVAKGLIAGVTIIEQTSGPALSQGADGKEYLIPDLNSVISTQAPGARWILVVEKESTFRTLVSHSLHVHGLQKPGLIVTAKGYPDLSTRSFLRNICLPSSPGSYVVPTYMLADYDPDGIAIMSTYKYGSLRLSHENETRLPNLRWLGLKSKDVAQFAQWTQSDGAALMNLTLRDRNKAVSMLKSRRELQEQGEEPEWRRELQVMLMLGFKAEMEILERNARMGNIVANALAHCNQQS